MPSSFIFPVKHHSAPVCSGFYPEQTGADVHWLEKAAGRIASYVLRPMRTLGLGQRRILREIHEYACQLIDLDYQDLQQKACMIRTSLRKDGLQKDHIFRSFALVRETAARTVGMKHFDVQLLGAWAMIHGRLVEMDTGEGKTLTATLAAVTAAFAGMPVHIVTSNDYLVERDRSLMAPLYQALGLTVAAVTQTMDSRSRQAAYASDIVYCTNKQLAFDYLRDRLVLGNDSGRLKLQLERLHTADNRLDRLFLRGLFFAIIDEADSVLVDEARTPLIISRPADVGIETELYEQALQIAGKLEWGQDYNIDKNSCQVQLSLEGDEHIKLLTADLGPLWQAARRSQELIVQGLKALHLYIRDRHYLVSNEKIVIIDENTGRIMPDRLWEKGLHQIIEVKEGCPVSGKREPLARITYQRFFRRYGMLAGMTGTAREIRDELYSVYGLSIQKIPTNKSCKRRYQGQKLYRDKRNKWQAVIARINTLRDSGRPVLVGTRSVKDSECLSTLLTDRRIAHQVLNARQDENEANIIAGAGQSQQVTIATNMAGRGTDIPLGKGVAGSGGLHVIATERNDSARVDRQLFGRCGRQGDPGSYEFILSLEDELVAGRLVFQARLQQIFQIAPGITERVGLAIIKRAQRAVERQNYCIRRDLLQLDEQLGRTLAFTGKLE